MSWQDFKAVDFCITSYCQARCPSCPRTSDMEEGYPVVPWLKLEHLNVDDWKRSIEEMDWSEHTFTFCGEVGDPMMHPDISEFCDHSFNVAEFFRIHTNGGLRKPKWYAEAAKNYGKKLFITFSIDGISQETNEKYRIGVNFDRAMENMLTWHEVVKSLNVPRHTVWDFLVFEHNWHEIPEAVKIAEQNRLRLRLKLNTQDYGLLKSKEGMEVFNAYT